MHTFKETIDSDLHDEDVDEDTDHTVIPPITTLAVYVENELQASLLRDLQALKQSLNSEPDADLLLSYCLIEVIERVRSLESRYNESSNKLLFSLDKQQQDDDDEFTIKLKTNRPRHLQRFCSDIPTIRYLESKRQLGVDDLAILRGLTDFVINLNTEDI